MNYEFSDLYKNNLTLFSGVLNKEIIKYESFWHVKSNYSDEWYNFIVPCTSVDNFDLAKAQQIQQDEGATGTKVSYYISGELISEYTKLLTKNDYSSIGDDTYMLKKIENVAEVSCQTEIHQLTSEHLEEYLALSDICFPEWTSNREYGKHFFDLSINNPYKNKDIKTFILQVDGKLVGFSSIIIDLDVGLSYLHNTGVHPDYRKLGYHTALVNFRCNYAFNLGVNQIYAIVEENSNSYKNFVKLCYKKTDKFHMFYKKV